ncbi:uncharacterized protein A1O9_02031 [Exophiala aquamarina CBS 119918]|uniref:Amino acid permease n=1 Tax=Exophiala aquamarina CBS 119918 TaxID=1182545 RepID=A0A072PXZ0_9EURO|nr:uncharacterized protein A1O9_02031 [Exophiala aquamarina CBS 119918]KEF60470.1 hypothetical protein A1O9_02031 [Exophiala aquamarina CBS 119918]
MTVETQMGTTAEPSSNDGFDRQIAAEGQGMSKRFSLLSLGAVSFSITCTWVGAGASVGIGLTQSSAATLWSLPIAGVMTLVLSLGMAELSSAYPLAGAGYLWSYLVASDEYKPFASFFNGFLSVIGWWLAAGSVANFISVLIMAIVVGCHPAFEPQSWQQYLIFVSLLWLAAAVNILGIRWLPQFNQLVFSLSVLTLSATTIALFVCGRQDHASTHFLFANFDNGQSGWSNHGFSFLLAAVNSIYGFLGTDCGAHLCEEIANPAKHVPRVIVYPLVMGIATAFPFLCSLLYSIKDLSAVLSTPTGLPLLEIFVQATGSKSAAVLLTSVFTFCMFGCLVAWAMSGDGALPGSHLWRRLHPRFNMPANSILLTTTFVSLYGLIFLGSTTAFAAMVSATIMFLQTSCAMPQAILLFRGRNRILPNRFFQLGIFGPVVNAIAVAWVVLIDILACFPIIRPVDPQNMNYMSVVSAGLVSMVLVFWFTTKRRKFRGPDVDFELMNARRQAAVHANVTDTIFGSSDQGETKM